MMMRQICALLSLACIASAAWLEKAPASPGDLVASSEVEHAMGSGCGTYGTRTWLCYGGNCMSGGCGCVFVNQIVPGTFGIDPAITCGTKNCTIFQSVSGSCTGS